MAGFVDSGLGVAALVGGGLRGGGGVGAGLTASKDFPSAAAAGTTSMLAVHASSTSSTHAAHAGGLQGTEERGGGLRTALAACSST